MEMETDAQKVLRLEAEAILDSIPRIDADFDAAVEMILQCQGRVVDRYGKSGIIARKISATLASKYGNAVFLSASGRGYPR